jgi:hypothetical protein
MNSDILINYLKENSQELDNLENYSIINCLSESEVESLYFKHELQELVVKYIKKYINKQNRLYSNCVKSLISDFKILSIKERSDIRDILYDIAPHTSKSNICQIYRLFINSKSKIENRRAAQISYFIWNEDVQQEILDLYRNNQDKFIAVELIKNLPKAEINPYFKELWNYSLRFRDLKLLISKSNILENNIEFFLKGVSPKDYLISLIIRNERLEEVKRMYLDIPYEDRIYLKWVAGENNKRDLLVKLIEMDKGCKEDLFSY